MSAPSVLERCRMALAEIGRAQDEVYEDSVGVRFKRRLPPVDRWRLRCTAEPDRPICWPCCAAAMREMQRTESGHEQRKIGVWGVASVQRESCGAHL